VGVAPQTTLIHILEAAAMETGLVVADAAALANGLARDGRIRVDGIFFDTGRATLKAESAPALEQVAKLLREQAQLQLYVVGHTDSQGQFQQNMSLSRARAEAVMQALVRDYGISASRLEAHGVGPLVPASTNRQEGGRSQNRRVEIVER
jgi:outer membrane protein OmpA-like peptidoglycan-associated protein